MLHIYMPSRPPGPGSGMHPILMSSGMQLRWSSHRAPVGRSEVVRLHGPSMQQQQCTGRWHHSLACAPLLPAFADAAKTCPACRSNAVVVGATFSPATLGAQYDWPKLVDGHVTTVGVVYPATTQAPTAGAKARIQAMLDQAYTE